MSPECNILKVSFSLYALEVLTAFESNYKCPSKKSRKIFAIYRASVISESIDCKCFASFRIEDFASGNLRTLPHIYNQ